MRRKTGDAVFVERRIIYLLSVVGVVRNPGFFSFAVDCE